jgi:phosphohistidine phosphatase
MSRTVVLIRHAKAESGEEGSDHERRLTGAGIATAQAAGTWLAAAVPQVDAVWCSSATRARQTWEAVAPVLTGEPAVDFDRALYLAGVDDVLDHLGSTEGTVVVVGHNPTLEAALGVMAPDTSRGMRPGAVAVIEVTDTAGPGSGRLRDFWDPPR